MKYPLIHQKIFNEPWLIEESVYGSIRQTFLARCGIHAMLDGQSLAEQSPKPTAFLGNARSGREEAKLFAQIGGTAIVPMHGIIGKMLSSFEMYCGGMDIDAFMAAVDAAMADDSVESVLMHIDSPGGTVTGVPEAAARLAAHAAAGEKDLIAFTETMSASAAYYLGSQAHRFFAAPSSRVGSIGVVVTLENRVEADALEGLSYTTFTSGRLKDLGNPHRAMTKEEEAIIEGDVMELARDFWAAVAAGRGIEPDAVQATEAHLFRAKEALELDLIDGLASNVAEVLQLID